MMEYDLMLGDCLDVMPTLTEPVDMILADLPYGTTACAWDSVIPFEPLWAQYKRLIKPRGAIVLFGSQPFTSALVMSNAAWFKYEWVWRKSSPSRFQNAKHMPMLAHEAILIFGETAITYNPQLRRRIVHGRKTQGRTIEAYGDMKRTFSQKSIEDNNGTPLTVINFNSPNHACETVLHPTQKPVALLEYLIRTYTNEGETVLDNTMGSGSTGVAAMLTGRRFIGIELDAGYFAIAEKRIADAARTARGEFRTYTDTSTVDDLPLFAEATR